MIACRLNPPIRTSTYFPTFNSGILQPRALHESPSGLSGLLSLNQSRLCWWSPRSLIRKLAAQRPSLPNSELLLVGFFHSLSLSLSLFRSFPLSLSMPVNFHKKITSRSVLRSGPDKQITSP